METLSNRLRAEFESVDTIYADGIAGAVHLGVNFAGYYYRWGPCENGIVKRHAAFIIIRPIGSICDMNRFLQGQHGPSRRASLAVQ